MITLQAILNTEPCYDETYIRELWDLHVGDRASIRPSELVGVVHDGDVLWVLCRLARPRIAREAARDWTARTLALGIDRGAGTIAGCATLPSAWYAAWAAACTAAAIVSETRIALDGVWPTEAISVRAAARRGMLLDLVERMEGER